MLEGVPAGKFVRPAGLDFDKDQVLLRAGMVLTARDVGLAAAMNVPWLKVRRRPRIAHMATGNEVVMPGEPLGPDQIISSNSLALGAYVKALGGEPINLGIARDDEESLRGILAGARGADLLVTLGGASVGEYDLVRKVLGDEGLDLTFFKVAMRPGKPLVFGRLGDIPVLGLPGNPVSVGVTSVVFLKPAMEVMLGIRRAEGPAATALLGRDLGENDRRQEYMRATVDVDGDGALVATPFDAQDSAMMAGLARADCLVVRPPHAPQAKAGERVEIIRLREGMISL
jgi:molybdopterin molybdotransferase